MGAPRDSNIVLIYGAQMITAFEGPVPAPGDVFIIEHRDDRPGDYPRSAWRACGVGRTLTLSAAAAHRVVAGHPPATLLDVYCRVEPCPEPALPSRVTFFQPSRADLAIWPPAEGVADRGER